MSSNEQLIKLKKQLEENYIKIEDNAKYVLGKNPPILNREQQKEPDNRLPITFAKMTVDDMAGYAGRNGYITSTYDLVDTESKEDEDPFIEYCRGMDKYNKSELENSELYYEILEQGYAYEIYWVSEEKDLPKNQLTTEFKIVPSSEVVVVYNNSIKKKMIEAVHFTATDEIEEATVYTPFLNQKWQTKKDSDTWTFVSEEETPFSLVPVNKYTANRRELSIFACEKHMIDSIDETISKTFNEIERFASAILLMGSKADPVMIAALKNNKITILDDLGEDTDGKLIIPQYLEKNLSGVKDFTNDFVKQMEQWYRDSTKTINVADEKFGVAEAGIALMLKLMPMEFRASQIETYFNQGLMRRLRYYADVYNASTVSVDFDKYTTIIKSQRNIPVDDAAIVEMLAKLQGILSEATLLEAMPKSIVPDPEKELERKADQMVDISGNGMFGADDEQGLDVLKEAEGLGAGTVIDRAQDIAAKVGMPLDAGGLTREAAINQLIIFIGLSRADAEKIVGTKKTGVEKSKVSE